jgi:hypothetical protein
MARAGHLSQTELDALLAWLAPCREQAGEKYEAIRRTLLKFFKSRKCEAAEERVDETIDRVARRIAGGELVRVDPSRYFRGVARKISLESFKRRARNFDLHHLALSAVQYPHERPRSLDACLRALPAQTRELLEGYYLGDRAALAATLGITPNALRLRVFKEKRKLRAEIAQRRDDDSWLAERLEIFDAESPLRGEASEARC